MRSQGYGALHNNETTPLKTSGPAPTVAYVQRQPKDYRVGALLATAFCFFPIGFIALYFSYQVSKFYFRGELAKATAASQRTKFLLHLTIIAGCLIWFGAVFILIYSRD